jgi:hypothetical protein
MEKDVTFCYKWKIKFIWEIPHAKLCISELIMNIPTYDFVIANLLCLPEESRQTLAFTTFSPKFLRALIFKFQKTQIISMSWLYDLSNNKQREFEWWKYTEKIMWTTYSIKKIPKTVTQGYFHNSCIRVRVLIYYNFRCRNCISVARAPVLLTKVYAVEHGGSSNVLW